MREPDKSRKSAWWRVRAACTAFGRDRDGSALFYTTISLPVLIGFAVLAIDGSRLMNLNSTLQHAADGLALAAAGELDRKSDACDRAVLALEKVVENRQMFGDLGHSAITIDDVSWRFIDVLPASDDLLIVNHFGDDCTEAQAAVTRFIEVTIDLQDFSTLFPASFLGGSNTARTNATAVAGFDAAVCEFTPLFICNPWDKSIVDVIEDGDNIGKQIKFHMVPPGCDETCDVTPGNFGLLESSQGGKLKDIKEELAIGSPNQCFIQNSVTTKPGISGIGNWLNVRFDMYEADANQLTNKKGYGPARNVRKGYDVKNCSKQDPLDPPVTRLGRDPEFTGFIGNGKWDFEAYWAANKFPTGLNDKNWSNVNRPTRYEVYQHELDNYEELVVGGTESGKPLCATPETSVDRRIIYAAVLDCRPDGVVKGKHTGQAEGFIEMFLTEPAAKEPGSGPETIYVEIVDLVEPGNSTVARDRVQLYR
jgi:hypothetical protein